MRKRIASIIALILVLPETGCWPWIKTAKLRWDTPSVPIAFRTHSSSPNECRFGWLKFEAEVLYNSTLTEQKMWDFLEQCGVSIGTTRFVAEAMIAPKVAAADAALQLSRCVASKANEHIRLNHIQVTSDASGWGACL